MGQKTVRVMTIHATVDEQALRTTLARIEDLRVLPETVGLDLCYGAVISLEITPEQIENDGPTMLRCHIRAGGWTDELPPRAQSQKGLQA